MQNNNENMEIGNTNFGFQTCNTLIANYKFGNKTEERKKHCRKDNLAFFKRWLLVENWSFHVEMCSSGLKRI